MMLGKQRSKAAHSAGRRRLRKCQLQGQERGMRLRKLCKSTKHFINHEEENLV